MKDPLFHLVQKLLNLHSIPFEKEELEFQIQSHPSYPSLHSITGVLDHFNISNIALDIPKTESILNELPSAFLAKIKTETYDDFTVVNKNNNYYDLYKTNTKKKETLNTSDFLEQFTGVVVAVEKEEDHELTNKQKYKLIAQTSTYIVITLLMIFTFRMSQPTLYNGLFLLTSLVGIILSVTIIKQEYGQDSFIGNAFCENLKESKNCAAVINSKGATIIRGLKLSDLSIIYFTGVFLASFLLTLSQTTLSSLLVISLAVFPITLYSIYYQFRVLKKWCALCLGIVFVLWFQFGFSISKSNIYLENPISSFSISVMSFIIALVSWNFIKPLLTTNKDYKHLKIEHYKFKRNYNLFSSVLQQSKQIDIAKNLNPVVIGTPNSALKITIISNPFCGHCKDVHFLIEDIMNTSKDIEFQVIFNVNTKDMNSDSVKVTCRLLEIYNTSNEAILLKAMNDIYGDRDTDKWLDKWSNCSNPQFYLDNLKLQQKWCSNNDINFTPEILINRRRFPKDYKRTDIKFFIEDLKENNTINTKTSQVQI